MSHARRDEATERPTLRQRVWAFAYERLGLEVAAKLAAKKTVPVHRCTAFYFLGGMALFLFGIQIVTGTLLSLYYKPSPDQAFESVRAIMTEVDFGWLIRSVHSWSANLLIGILFLHVLSTYMMRAYRRPREFTWITGILLLGLFMAFGFSGYLLPWNELAFFATRVGTSITGKVPLIGEKLLLWARGGEEVTGDTLARFYALHVVVFPLLAYMLLGVHLFLVQHHGMSVPEREAARYGGADKVPAMPFVPHFLLRDVVGWYLALGMLAALAALFPWDLGEKANPFASAPEGIQPEWYFLFMFQTLKILPSHILGIEGDVLGVLFFGFCGLVVLLVPLLDAGKWSRQMLNFLAAVSVVFFIVMTAWGWFPASPRLGTILATGLSLGMLAILYPFVDRGTRTRTILNALVVVGVLVLIVATVWELFG